MTERIIEQFEADPDAELRTAIGEVRSKVRHRGERQQFVAAALNAYRRAAGEGRYEAAEQLVNWARDAASPAVGGEWLEAARQYQADFAKVKDDIMAARSGEAVLRTNPQDPRANRLYGRYLLCYTADVKQGLARLAHGDDADLKRFAERELLVPKMSAQALYELAEEWWQWSAMAGALARRNVRQRLRPWYEKARTGLTGTMRARGKAVYRNWTRLRPSKRRRFNLAST